MPLYQFVDIKDEGSLLGKPSTIDFTGAGVSSSISGDTVTVNIPGGAGTGASGTTTVNFGSNSDLATTTITGQTSILSNSIVRVWVNPTTTANNTADNHLVEDLIISHSDIVAGTGFTIKALPKIGKAHGIYSINWKWE